MAMCFVCDVSVCLLAYTLKYYQGELVPDSVFINCPMCFLKTKSSPKLLFLKVFEYVDAFWNNAMFFFYSLLLSRDIIAHVTCLLNWNKKRVWQQWWLLEFITDHLHYGFCQSTTTNHCSPVYYVQRLFLSHVEPVKISDHNCGRCKGSE